MHATGEAGKGKKRKQGESGLSDEEGGSNDDSASGNAGFIQTLEYNPTAQDQNSTATAAQNGPPGTLPSFSCLLPPQICCQHQFTCQGNAIRAAQGLLIHFALKVKTYAEVPVALYIQMLM